MLELNPKARFKQSQADARFLSDVVTHNSFLNALQSALAQMQMDMPRGDNPAQAWDCHCRMEGAKKFINILLNLAEPDPVQKILPSKNLLNPETPLRKKE